MRAPRGNINLNGLRSAAVAAANGNEHTRKSAVSLISLGERLFLVNCKEMTLLIESRSTSYENYEFWPVDRFCDVI